MANGTTIDVGELLSLVATLNTRLADIRDAIKDADTTLESLTGAPTGAAYVVTAGTTQLSAERILTGTANQITVTDGGGGGNVTLSLPSSLIVPGSLRVTTDLTIDDQLIVSGVGPNVIGGAAVGSRQVNITGTFSGSGTLYGLVVVSTLSSSSGGSELANLAVAGSLTQSAGTNPRAAGGLFYAPTLSGTHTSAATLLIDAAPTGATNNYALWVDAGAVRLDATTANGTVATAMSALGPTGSNTTIQEWLTININGTVRYIPCF